MQPRDAHRSSPGAGASSRFYWWLLALSAILPAAALLVLCELDTPLGKPGKFTYLYSPIVARRLSALPAALLAGVVLAGGLGLVFSSRRRRRRLGLPCIALGIAALGWWAYVAPPQFRSQVFFNMQSPSHDGAFLLESSYARTVGVRNYLRNFPERSRTPPEAMRGTRVISNPPGATLLAVGTSDFLARAPRLRAWLRPLSTDEDLPPEACRLAIHTTGFALSLLLIWLLSAPCLYGAARLFFGIPAALVFTIVCLLTPATLLFSPGKDPAQLFTVALPLWLWLLAWRRDRSWVAALSGGVFILACLLGLVHVWIAAIVLAATASATPKGERTRLVRRVVLPAGGAALAVIGVLAVAGGVNFFATLAAVARSQAEITRGAGAMPLVWQALGIPLFLLFGGPALLFCMLGCWRSGPGRDGGEARFGSYLLVYAVIVMVATVGFTNAETPRLWIPFVPLLLLGAALRMPLFHWADRRAGTFLAALVFLQVAVSAAQWSLMDMREAETRLLRTSEQSPRFFE